MKKNFFYIKSNGNSMFPILHDGDLIEYVHSSFGNIKTNDIVLLYEKSRFVTHRVIYKEKNYCITRGDNNRIADPKVHSGGIFGKVIGYKRKGKSYKLQDIYYIQSGYYLSEIQKLQLYLKKDLVPHVFLKGVLLSLQYLKKIPKRIYADCDILLERKHILKVHLIFKSLGYTLYRKSTSSRKKDDETYLKNYSLPEISYIKNVNGVVVVFDVHFEPVFLMTQIEGMFLMYPNTLLTRLGEQLISRKMSKKINGTYYNMCSVSDQIIYLALHIFHHNYTDTMRYELLDAVIRRAATYEVWKDIKKTIKVYRLEGYLYLVFHLLKSYYHTPIPSTFSERIKPSIYKTFMCELYSKKINIFNQDGYILGGVQRFLLIFFLSPEPFWKKFCIFMYPKALLTSIRYFHASLFKRS